jgi:hypothetical protein
MVTKPPRKVRVRVVRVKGKEEILGVLRSLGFSYRINYDIVEDEEDDSVVYKYEELDATGIIDGVYVTVECHVDGCKVENPIYRYDDVEPCHCNPSPQEIKACVDKVIARTREVIETIRNLQTLAKELERFNFQVDILGMGAEAYLSLNKGYIRAHLTPRVSLIQLQVQAEPTKIVELARKLAEVLRGG